MLNCSISKEGDVEMVYLSGELDATSASELSKTLLDLVKRESHHIILEMGDVSYISSNGLLPLLEWLEATKHVSGNRKLAVCNLTEFAQEVFRILSFDRKFPVFDDPDEALRAFRQYG